MLEKGNTMSVEAEPTLIKGFTTKKILAFMGFFFVGMGASFLAKAYVPYVQENPITLFIIFPAIAIPCCLLTLRWFPKCTACGKKTKPAPTPKGSEFDNLSCSSCNVFYKIDSMTRN